MVSERITETQDRMVSIESLNIFLKINEYSLHKNNNNGSWHFKHIIEISQY